MAADDGNLVPIGRFAQISRLTIKALRHYDDLGLLKPAHTDPASGYRYYSLGQIAAAELIRTLRATEMPLDEIGAVLCEADPAAVRAQLVRHEARLAERIAAQHEAIARLRRLIDPREAPMTYAIEIAAPDPRPIVGARTIGPQPDLSRVVPRTLDAVLAHLRAHGAAPSGPPFVIYHDGGGDEAFAMEIGWTVDEPPPDAGDFRAGTLGGTPAARTIHPGPYDRLSAAYAALAGWVQAHGHETAGSPYEIYVSYPEGADPDDYRTEVYWPIG